MTTDPEALPQKNFKKGLRGFDPQPFSLSL
jgi:hypothetical protein